MFRKSVAVPAMPMTGGRVAESAGWFMNAERTGEQCCSRERGLVPPAVASAPAMLRRQRLRLQARTMLTVAEPPCGCR
jgi:hypothetical protein